MNEITYYYKDRYRKGYSKIETEYYISTEYVDKIILDHVKSLEAQFGLSNIVVTRRTLDLVEFDE